jgi:hypothetical protein
MPPLGLTYRKERLDRGRNGTNFSSVLSCTATARLAVGDYTFAGMIRILFGTSFQPMTVLA